MVGLPTTRAPAAKTTNAGIPNENEKSVNFNVQEILESHNEYDDCSCACPTEDVAWKEGVQQFYDGLRTASSKFSGQSYNLANTTLKSFEKFVAKLIYFTNTNSTLLSSSSTEILASLSEGNNIGQSSLNIIIELDKALLVFVKEFYDIVKKLSDAIGHLTCSINDVILDLGYAVSSFLKEFLKCSDAQCREKTNFKPVFKQFQRLMNTVALIAETLLNGCEPYSSEVDEAMMVLTLICHYFLLTVQGINSSVQDVLYEEKSAVSENIESCSKALDFMIVQMAQAVSALVFPITKSIEELLTSLVNITMAFNTAVKDILGVFDGVGVTVGEIKRNLWNGLKHSATNDRTNILKGIDNK